jgi:hypothetical protein
VHYHQSSDHSTQWLPEGKTAKYKDDGTRAFTQGGATANTKYPEMFTLLYPLGPDERESKRGAMKKELGLWIDHSEAVIVSISSQGEDIKRIRSDVEPHERYSANSPQGRPEDRRDRRFGEHLHRYYGEVIDAIREADSILILGPGEAKGELEKQLELQKLSGRIVGIETTDKLTEPQIVAEVRRYFLV